MGVSIFINARRLRRERMIKITADGKGRERNTQTLRGAEGKEETSRCV
jgi:hypothetical protein